MCDVFDQETLCLGNGIWETRFRLKGESEAGLWTPPRAPALLSPLPRRAQPGPAPPPLPAPSSPPHGPLGPGAGHSCPPLTSRSALGLQQLPSRLCHHGVERGAQRSSRVCTWGRRGLCLPQARTWPATRVRPVSSLAQDARARCPVCRACSAQLFSLKDRDSCCAGVTSGGLLPPPPARPSTPSRGHVLPPPAHAVRPCGSAGLAPAHAAGTGSGCRLPCRCPAAAAAVPGLGGEGTERPLL